MVPAAFMSRDAGNMVPPGPIGELGEMTSELFLAMRQCIANEIRFGRERMC